MENITASEVFNFVQGSNITGESSFDVWKSLNPDGTAVQFIEHLRGDSAFEVWEQLEGNEGKTEQEFFESIAGNTKIELPSDEEILSMMSDIGLFTPIMANENTTYVDDDGKILIL